MEIQTQCPFTEIERPSKYTGIRTVKSQETLQKTFHWSYLATICICCQVSAHKANFLTWTDWQKDGLWRECSHCIWKTIGMIRDSAINQSLESHFSVSSQWRKHSPFNRHVSRIQNTEKAPRFNWQRWKCLYRECEYLWVTQLHKDR